MTNKHFRTLSRQALAPAEDDEFEFDLVLKLEFATNILQAVDGWVQRKTDDGQAE
ncbi:MAG: hypothetical protein ACLFU6_06470 [Candidatus Hydrogenedentota bacterium]